VTGAFLERVQTTINRHGMLRCGDVVVVAVSGGRDSCALLAALHALKAETGLRQIVVAHLNHGLREPDSTADAEFVQGLAASLGLPACVEQEDVGRLAEENRLSVESAAHEARYGFLARVSARHGAQAVALGHTLEDRTETFFMHLFRGAGMSGLSSMRPILFTEYPDGGVAPRLIRPLIDCTHEEVDRYLASLGIQPKVDATNADTRHLRNRIRHQVLAEIREKICPDIDRRVGQLMSLCEDEDAFLREQSFVVLAELRKGMGGDGSSEEMLDRSRFSQLDRALQRRIVRHVFQSLCCPRAELNFQHVENLLHWLNGGVARGRFTLPGGVEVETTPNELVFYSVHGSPGDADAVRETPVPLQGTTWLAQFAARVETRVFDRPHGCAIPRNPETAWIDADLVGQLTVRCPRPGDRFRPLGAKGTQKLQDFFVNSKIPRRQRCRTPLLVSATDIAWVMGCRLDDRYKITNGTRRILEVYLRPESPSAGGDCREWENS